MAKMETVAGDDASPCCPVFNPGMGIYQFASLLENDPAEGDIGRESRASWDNPYVSGTVVYVPWRRIEPEEGVFRWDKMDALMEPWARNGKRCLLRVCPARREIATPEWVFEAGARHVAQRGMQAHSQDDMAYENKFPVYWDPVFLEKYNDFITAFAERYDRDPRVEAIQIALGKWGESFLGSEVDLGALRNTLEAWEKAGYSEARAIDTFKNIIMAYKQAFVHTQLTCMVGGPFVGALRSAGSARNTEEIAAFCVDNGVDLQQNGFSSAYRNYVNCSNIFNRYYRKVKVMYEIGGAGCADGRGVAGLVREMLKAHVSYAFVYTKNLTDGNPGVMENLKRLHERIGYQLELKDVAITDAVGDSLVVNMRWLNKGVAPVYDGISCRVAVFDAADVKTAELDAALEPGLASWTERQTIYSRLRLELPSSLGKGEHALKLVMENRKGHRVKVSVRGKKGMVSEIDLGKVRKQ